MEFLLKQKRTLWITGIMLFGASAAIGVYQAHKKETEKKAADSFYKARKSLEDEIKAITDSSVTKESAKEAKGIEPNSINIDSQLSKSKGLLAEVVTLYSGSRASFEAALMLGSLYFDYGKSADSKDQALIWFRKAKQIAGSKSEKIVAGLNEGVTLEVLEKYDEAIQVLSILPSLDKKSPWLKDVFSAASRCYEKLGQVDKAKSALQQIITYFPGTAAAEQAEKSIQKMDGVSQRG